MKLFRYRFIIPTLITLILGILFFRMIVPSLIHKGIVSASEKAFKAKVDIKDVDISIFPPGIQIESMRVANKEKPLFNLFQFEKLRFQFEWSPLLQKHLVINDASLNGLQFNTPRKTSGSLTKKSKTQEKPSKESESGTGYFEKLSELSPKINVSELINTNELAVLKTAHSIEANIKTTQSKWDQQFKNTDINAEVNALQNKANKLLQTKKIQAQDIPKLIKDIQELNNDIQKTQKKYQTQFQNLQSDISQLSQSIEKLPQQAKEDSARILKSSGLSLINSNALMSQLFGHRLVNAVGSYLKIKKEVSKYTPTIQGPTPIPSIKGRTILFPSTKKPTPRFWLKHMSLSGQLASGLTWSGTLTHLSTNQNITHHPITLDAASQPNQTQSFKLQAQSTHTDKVSKETLSFNATNYPLKNIHILGKDKNSIDITDASLNTALQLTLDSNQLNSILALTLHSITLSETTPDELISTILKRTISNQNKITLNLKATGNPLTPQITGSSNLDTAIQKEINEIYTEKLAALETQIQSQINTILQTQTQQLNSTLEQALGDKKEYLNTQSNQLNEINQQIEKEKKKLTQNIYKTLF